MARTKQQPREVCTWEVAMGIDDDHYETDCGEAWQFTVGGPRENKMRFCPYCGKRLRAKD